MSACTPQNASCTLAPAGAAEALVADVGLHAAECFCAALTRIIRELQTLQMSACTPQNASLTSCRSMVLKLLQMSACTPQSASLHTGDNDS